MQLFSHYRQQKQNNPAQITNWQGHELGKSLYYSHRETHYNIATFPSRLHCHNYFELVIFESGNIHYICESVTYQPKAGDILLVSPKNFHMSMLHGSKTLYKRHVFYLYPDALDPFGCGILTSFLNRVDNGLTIISLENHSKEELLILLRKLSEILTHKQDSTHDALAISFVIQIFYLLNSSHLNSGSNSSPLPNKLSSIKAYINENFLEISSTHEVATHFFYSREYVSRIFRKHFNTTVSEYIRARRVAHCQKLIEQGCPITEACYQSGFDNMSTCIRSFRNVVNMNPSEYRKTIAKKSD